MLGDVGGDQVVASAGEGRSQSSPGLASSRRAGRAGVLVVVSLAVLVTCALIYLAPVLVAPITADDRYWYLQVAPRTRGSFVELLSWSWDQISIEGRRGRFAPIGSFERRLAQLLVMEASIATGLSAVIMQAVQKFLLVAAIVLSYLAFLRSLRWRDAGGLLVRVSGRTLLLVGAAAPVAIGVGAQAHAQFRNGWTSYSVLTYGSLVFILLSVAVLLWLTRLVAERPRLMAAPAVLVLLLLAVATNYSYELAYLAVPAGALALLLVPVVDRSRRAVGLRAKAATGGAYLGGFTAVFLVMRAYIADLCAGQQCYVGAQPEIGLAALRTAAFNLAGAFPGFAGNKLMADLRRVGWEDRYPVGTSAFAVLLGLVTALALAGLWWSVRALPGQGDGPAAGGRSEAVLLAVGALVSLAIGVGAAVLMGLSGQSHELITAPGLPYRNTMITWSTSAVAAVLLARAAALWLGGRVAVLAWVALALLVGGVGTTTLDENYLALRANRASQGMQVHEDIFRHLAVGDTTSHGDTGRCRTFRRLTEVAGAGYARELTIRFANDSFEYFHGTPFCSDLSYEDM